MILLPCLPTYDTKGDKSIHTKGFVLGRLRNNKEKITPIFIKTNAFLKVVPTFFSIEPFIYLSFSHAYTHLNDFCTRIDVKKEDDTHDTHTHKRTQGCMLTQSLIFFCLCCVCVQCVRRLDTNKVDNEIDKENILDEIK